MLFSKAAFDALGMLVGTAIQGKVAADGKTESGDSLEGFVSDLTQSKLDAFFTTPKTKAPSQLKKATIRIIYNLNSYFLTKDTTLPPYAATLTRELHSGMSGGDASPVQVSFSYSDGFGREIQKKIQAEPENPGGPLRWVGSGWTVFNNKSKAVCQYEPFFTDTHCFEFDIRIGVSPVLFYDPVKRVVATLNPNHTWEKMIFDPWRQKTWDVSNTVLVADPGSDSDVGDFFLRLPDTNYLPTWYAQRQGSALGFRLCWSQP